MILKVKKLNHRALPLEYHTSGASGFDLRALIGEYNQIVYPGQKLVIDTGYAFEIPKGYELQIRPRSSVSLHTDLKISNTPGTIDSDYRGEVKLIVENIGIETISISHNERIAQAVLCPVVQAKFQYVAELTKTNRGENGHGSTGTI